MKIKMIGTGSISGKERSSSILVNDKILIDLGNGIVKTLLEQKVDISKIRVLLISHLHGDHFLDIPFLIMQRSFEYMETDLKIYCPIRTQETIKKIISLIYADVEDWTVLMKKAKVEFIEFEKLNNENVLEDYFISAYKTEHGDIERAYAFVISDSDKVVGISGDSIYCDIIDKIVELSDISILDMSFIESNSKHMGVNDIKLISDKYGKQIIATHMTKAARDYAKNKDIKNLIIPIDGQVIEV